MSRKTRAKSTFDTIGSEQSKVRQAAGVPSMTQYNGVRERVTKLEGGLDAEQQERKDADGALDQRIESIQLTPGPPGRAPTSEEIAAATAAYLQANPPKNGNDGKAATIKIGTVTTGAVGSPITVSNSGTESAVVLDFSIPRPAPGADGKAATLAVGTVSTGAAGSSATVTNSGTSSAAVLDITIPRGAPGNDGKAATVTAGTASSLAAGAAPTVTNSGTSAAAVLNFGIPAGPQGIAGVSGAAAIGPQKSVTATTQLALSDCGYIRANAAAGAFDLTLPPIPSATTTGHAFWIVAEAGTNNAVNLRVPAAATGFTTATIWSIGATSGQTAFRIGAGTFSLIWWDTTTKVWRVYG